MGTNQYTSKKAKRQEKIRELLFAMLEDFRTHKERHGEPRQPTKDELRAIRYLIALEKVPLYLFGYDPKKRSAPKPATEDEMRELEKALRLPADLMGDDLDDEPKQWETTPPGKSFAPLLENQLPDAPVDPEEPKE